MRLILILVLICHLPLSLAAVPQMDLKQAHKLIQAGVVTVVDLRSQDDFQKAHLPNAVHLDDPELGKLLPQQPKQLYLCYNENGNISRSSKALRKLKKLGKGKSALIKTGFKGWLQAGLSIEKPITNNAAVPAAGHNGKVTHAGRPYWLHIPKNIDANKPIHLLIWCHPGSGKAEPEFRWWLQTKVLDTQTILLAPQAKQRQWTTAHDARWVRQVVNKVKQTYSISHEHTVLGGHSSGGFFTWSLGLQYQGDWSALLIACAYAPGPIPAATKQAPYVVLYHSPNDKVTPWQQMQKSRKALTAKGFKHDLTEDSLGHSIGIKLSKRYAQLRKN